MSPPTPPDPPHLIRRTKLRAFVVGSVFAVSLGAVASVVPAAPVGAAASAPARFVPVEPCRLLDTRTTGGPISPGGSVDVTVVGAPCGIPSNATAAALTITAVSPSSIGFVTVWPVGEARPQTSVVNYRAGQVVPNAQFVRLGSGGGVSLYTLAGADLVVDVTGYFAPTNGAVRPGRFVPVVSHRLADTRAGARPVAGGVVTVRPDVPAGSIAVAVNIATSQSTGPGYFTAYATGTDVPNASVLNTDGAGQTRAAAAVVPLSGGAFDVYTQRGDHVIVDLVGYFTGSSAPSSSDGLFVAATPVRLVDTRAASGPSGGPRLWAGGHREFAVAGITGGPVAAIAANITMTDTEDVGYVVAGPARVGADATSSVNADRAQLTVANAAIVGVSTVGVSFGSLDATHLVVDVTGWFTGRPVAATELAPTNLPPADRRVVVISDSAMAGVRWNHALGGFQGFDADARLESCRRLVQSSCRGREGYVPRTAQAEIAALPPAGPDEILVIAVGYNDWHERFASDVAIVLAAAHAQGFHHVAWVTYRADVGYTLPSSGGSHSNYAEMNRVLTETAASGAYPELRLWDLNEYSAGAPSWFASDGVHETTLGSWGIADWISRHVRAFDDRPCVHPWKSGGAIADPCPHPDALPPALGYPDIAAIYGF